MEQFRDLNFPALSSELLGEWFSFVLRGQNMASQGQETGNILRDKKRSQGPQSFSGARNVLNTPIVLSPKTELEWLRKKTGKGGWLQ